jgi:hypothetical protein
MNRHNYERWIIHSTGRLAFFWGRRCGFWLVVVGEPVATTGSYIIKLNCWTRTTINFASGARLLAVVA